jgi:uncharacterized membrane protein
MSGAAGRLRAIDWLRGLVMALMAVDHAGSVYDAHHLRGDSAWGWTPGTALPAGEFLTRWITHLCAPTFVLLAGAALALSSERRRDDRGQTWFIVKRGLLIAALDPTWMSLGMTFYHPVLLQVLYAIGLSLVCMAFLRRLSSPVLLVGAIAIQLLGELSKYWRPEMQPLRALWQLLFVGGPVWPPFRVICAYPVIPWLSIMMAGWVLGRGFVSSLGVRERDHRARARTLLLYGIGLLVLFAVVRGLDGYGNWDLHRDSLAPLQWLHVAKYPPSIAFTALELGIAFLLLALFLVLDDDSPRPLLRPLALFGSTAFFFYLLHIHLLGLFELVTRMDRQQHGLAKTYLGALAILIVLYPLCARYRRYKAAHPDSWTRYI